MEFSPVPRLEPLVAGAKRNCPIRAHLHVVISRLQGFVVECVAAAGIARGPDQRLVGIGEAAAAEVRHWIRFAPNHVVENPKSQILQQRTDSKNVVIRADHP